jgi:hypothetical protein
VLSAASFDPCNSKLDSTQPLALADWCTTHPNDPRPPFSVVGHGYKPVIWGCKDGMPVSVPDPNFYPGAYDEFGFYNENWWLFPEP